MDDIFERPSPISQAADVTRDDADEQSSGDEDGGLDWTKLPKGSNIHRPVIPKRGEKDFEPNVDGPSGLQMHNLDRARLAMFDALRSTRAISSKSISYAVWYPVLARAHVTTARGIHFNTSMGHSIARPSPTSDKLVKRLELLPEEALYLVEKGALFCWKAVDGVTDVSDQVDADGAMQGAPMSVQEAFASMIGTEDITLERYQVFSYLRRLGYMVTRAKPPSPTYPPPAPYPELPTLKPSYLHSMITSILSPFSRLFSSLFRPGFDWWKPLIHRRWLHHNMDYPSIFKSLRFIPHGHSIPLNTTSEPSSSPYEVFYHLYKPSTPFRKTAPPPPEWSVVVVDARTTPIPTLSELTALFDPLPILPPPLPRQRNPPSHIPSESSPTPSFFARILAHLPFRQGETASVAGPVVRERRVNPFMALRQGKKMAIIAAVDASVISFFRLGEGAFEEWPMV
ncbi:tRNA-splicing endonuclease subunit sen54 N-term-domain-containing protein [Amylostereum chailletii]|nr:tRNA-splicing endonuclease subunit sen54 N-term-domain-containing protein [Amylostereum chailletii]